MDASGQSAVRLSTKYLTFATERFTALLLTAGGEDAGRITASLYR
jgi:hypothetical protein